ncbi:hypothetical protein CDAR_27621 [Caerostris darwini]|uniref:Uncharacterized protein n=1 Tax=Caerostris darwini TaxID=1538125 RepID=A0AAV4SMR5_9ARAC|nr:hypothetical protein CDAR_27621 [Caerostris darwini]
MVDPPLAMGKSSFNPRASSLSLIKSQLSQHNSDIRESISLKSPRVQHPDDNKQTIFSPGSRNEFPISGNTKPLPREDEILKISTRRALWVGREGCSRGLQQQTIRKT